MRIRIRLTEPSYVITLMRIRIRILFCADQVPEDPDVSYHLDAEPDLNYL